MQVYRIKKPIHVAAVIDGVPEVFLMEKGQLIKGKFVRLDLVTMQILVQRGEALWAFPESAIETQQNPRGLRPHSPTD